MSRDVIVVPTGTANLASVLAGLRRAGAEPRTSLDPVEIRDADRVVLPGVGAFGAAMARLRERALVEPLRERVLSGRATLAVCLGLQLLCAESEESPGVGGLGVIDARVERFPAGLPVPQMGWNRVDTAGPGWFRFVEPGYAYFANSYRLRAAPEGWRAATATYGAPFVAALERGGVLACQFHPELSGAWGAELLRAWLAGVTEVSPC